MQSEIAGKAEVTKLVPLAVLGWRTGEDVYGFMTLYLK